MPSTGNIRAGRAFVELFADDSKLVRGLRHAESRLKAFGKRMQTWGRQLAKVAAVGAAPLAVSATTYAAFEKQMSRVKALTGASVKDMARLTAEAKRLGESTVFSASQAAEAMSFFALAGFKVDQILTAMGPTLNLAAAGQMEIAQAADIVAKVMAGMGIEADRIGYAVDVMTKAMTTANTDLVQLGEAMKYVGPIAKSAGIRLEEVVAAIQMLSNAGIQGEMAGTTLRGALLALTNPSSEAADTLKQLGVQVADAAGNVRPLADILEDLGKATAGMGSAEKLAVIGKIFPARQAAGMAELISQGADRLREFTKALEGAGGTAARIAGTQIDNLAGDAVILKSALEGLAIAVGESLVKSLRWLTQAITTSVGQIAAWVRENQTIIQAIAYVVGAVGALAAALMALGLVTRGLGLILGKLATIVPVVGGAFKLLGAVLMWLISPVGLVIAAVAALGAYILYATGAGAKALGWLGEKFTVLRDDAVAAWGGISDALAAGDIGLAAKILWLTLKMEWPRGINVLEKAWLDFRNFFLRIGYDAWTGLLAIVEYVWHGLEVGWIESVAFFKKLWSNLVAFFARLWQEMVAIAKKAWQWIKGLFSKSARESKDRVYAEIDRARDEAINRINSDSDRDKAASEAERQRRREQSQKTHDATLDEIVRDNQRRHNDLNREHDQRMKDNEGDLDKARDEWRKALDEARKKRQDKEAAKDDGPGKLEGPEDLLTKAKAAVAGMGGLLEKATIGVTGTFNAANVQGLQAGGVMDRMTIGIEKIERNTRTLRDADGIAFE